jgi:hypothetical protein
MWLIARCSHWKSEGLKRAREIENANCPESTEKSQETSSVAQNPGNRKTERRALVDGYIDEVFKSTGKRLTRKSIWQAVGYKTRAEFERWERCDERATATASERFVRLLTVEKPHLK